jgi:adenylyltransferase/sulfurtransferase
VHGSVSGFEGFISLFNLNSNSPCYRCLYPVIPNDGSGCSEAGVLPTVAGLVGIQMAHEGIKFLTGCGETLDGKVLSFRKNNFETFNLKKDPDCPICGSGKNLDKNKFQELTLDEFNKIKHHAEVIDIREEMEFNELNLGGTNIPFSSFEISKLAHLRDKEVIIICYSGERSKAILEILKNNNFRKIFNLKGGIREAFLN